MAKEVIESFDKYKGTFFPNSLLDRLAEEFSSRLENSTFNAKKIKIRIIKDKSNPKIGLIEVIKPNNLILSLVDIIKGFYKKEGYKVEQKDKNSLITVEKGKEKYWIVSYIGESSYSIRVSNALL